MTINSFRGDYRFLSNFFPAEVVFDHAQYASVEHAYQAAKTSDKVLRVPFQQPTDSKSHYASAGKAKREGKGLPLRSDWEKCRIEIMYELLQQKFQHENLRQKLVATEDEPLVEGNNWKNKFWGKCNGSGENHLGKLLMEVRSEVNYCIPPEDWELSDIELIAKESAARARLATFLSPVILDPEVDYDPSPQENHDRRFLEFSCLAIPILADYALNGASFCTDEEVRMDRLKIVLETKVSNFSPIEEIERLVWIPRPTLKMLLSELVQKGVIDAIKIGKHGIKTEYRYFQY